MKTFSALKPLSRSNLLGRFGLAGLTLLAACGGGGGGGGGGGDAPTAITYATNPAVYDTCTLITANIATVTGGAPDSFSISPALPTGLIFSTTTGLITGTPSTAAAVATYTVTATNSDGSAQVLLSLTVDSTAPTALDYDDELPVYCAGVAIATNAAIPTGTATAYAVASGTLPAGLTLNPTTGAITGTPTTAAPATDVDIEATNCEGIAATATITFTIDGAPTGLTYDDQAPTYRVGFPLTPNAATLAGGSASSYAVTAGTLPAGVELDAVTGTLSGTPLVEQSVSTVTITATADGCTGLSTTSDVDITVTLPSARAAYVCNQADDTVSILVQNASTGQLRHNGYVYTGASSGPRMVATNPAGTFAFVACNTTSTLLSYVIDPATGRLTASGTSVASAGNPVGLVVDPLGRFLYAANSTGTVTSYAIGSGNGQLTATIGASIAAGTSTSAIAIDPLGRFVYAANSGSDNLTGYSIDPGTGDLAPLAGSPFTVGDSPLGVVFDPTGGFLYVANAGTSDSVSGFSVDSTTGALTALAGSPYSAGSDPFSIAISSDGGEVYTPNATGGTLSVYSRDTSTGVLTAGAAVTTGTAPVAIGIDPAGAFLYSVNLGDAELRTYSIGALGALTATAPFELRMRASPRAITFAPSLSNASFTTDALYAANFSTTDFNQFSLDGTTGAPTALAPATVATQVSPNWISVHPTLDFLYVTYLNVVGAQVEGYALAPSGAATSIGILSTTQGNFATLLDPSGQFAFTIGGAVPGRVTPFTINPSTGALTAGTNATTGDSPRAGAVHPNGKWMYVANQLSGNVSQFQIDASTGALTALSPATVATGAAAQSIAIDPTGRLAYVACTGAAGAGNGTLSMFSINATTGVLSALAAVAPTGFDDPFDVAIHPNGRFLYVADQFAQNIREYLINTSPTNATEDGSLVLAATTTITLPVRFMQINAAGTFLYVGSESASAPSQRVQTYGINSANGNLTLVDDDATGASTRGIGLRDRVE
jgi:6-phosphogluconolactonase (cycloisomerase 2 family)